MVIYTHFYLYLITFFTSIFNFNFNSDGLVDCQDPDCCISIACKDSVHCLASPDPMEILLRKQPPSTTASFYERMRFLVEDDSVQSYATLSSFNQRSAQTGSDGKMLVLVAIPLVMHAAIICKQDPLKLGEDTD